MFKGVTMKFIFDDRSQMQLVYDLGFKITLSDLQRVKMYRHYLIHGFEFRYTSIGTVGYVFVEVGYNKFITAEYQYSTGDWFIYDVMELSNNTKRILRKCVMS